MPSGRGRESRDLQGRAVSASTPPADFRQRAALSPCKVQRWRQKGESSAWDPSEAAAAQPSLEVLRAAQAAGEVLASTVRGLSTVMPDGGSLARCEASFSVEIYSKGEVAADALQ